MEALMMFHKSFNFFLGIFFRNMPLPPSFFRFLLFNITSSSSSSTTPDFTYFSRLSRAYLNPRIGGRSESRI